MRKTIGICVGTVFLFCGVNVSATYTEQELEVLVEDCLTSLELHRQFSGEEIIILGDITLRTGDNCVSLAKRLISISHGTETAELYAKAQVCRKLLKDLINSNGGVQILPLPDHIK